jgi:hypothetical protein
MSVIATSTGVDNDEELHMPQRVWDELHEKGGFEHLEDLESAESSSEQNEDDE